MARHTELIAKRNVDLKKDYERLRRMRDGRQPKYTADYVITTLSEKYYISERTVEDIVWGKR